MTLPRLEIIPATALHRRLLRQMFELYSHDFSEMKPYPVNEHGCFTPEDFLDGWWETYAGGFNPFLLRCDNSWAGFAFVDQGSYIAPNVNLHWLMDEFFVLRGYRRRGIGTWFAQQLFGRFTGIWEIGQIPENLPATAFWRRTLARGNHAYEEIEVDNERWTGRVQLFDSSG
jgi:predicted acetyltransferase